MTMTASARRDRTLDTNQQGIGPETVQAPHRAVSGEHPRNGGSLTSRSPHLARVRHAGAS